MIKVPVLTTSRILEQDIYPTTLINSKFRKYMLDKRYLDDAGCEVLILSLREIRNSTRPNQNSIELKQLQDLFTK
ncbi:hypothetical protein Pmani_005255 [Petrolisthes manimaculis]|uniref:Uncharacterized protein n=1 Tax=Petrolisthes manimaculis TaxID=1843537 RepID=A0AAE1QF10_9EUCA|nr:hypothetical protein Pmani_005255 [Petrolisthes manimaculis]